MIVSLNQWKSKKKKSVIKLNHCFETGVISYPKWYPTVDFCLPAIWKNTKKVFLITKTLLFKYIENFTNENGKNGKKSDENFSYCSYSCSKYRLWVLVKSAF